MRARVGYRVLTIVPSHFFADYGCHVRILEEAEALQALGHSIAIVTYPGGRDVPGLQVHRPAVLHRTTRVHVGSSRKKIFLDVVLFWQCLGKALRFRPHIIHAHLHEGALIGEIIGRILSIPVVFDYQGSLTAEMLDHNFIRRFSPLFRPLHELEKSINRAADAVLVSSANAAKLLIDEDRCPAHLVYGLPDCVAPARFDPSTTPERTRFVDDMRAGLGIPVDRKVVVYLGLLAEYQGLTHLLNAAAQVVRQRPKTHFLLMGYPGQERYQGLATSLGIGDHVSFPGRIPYERAADYLSLGSVAVSTKQSRTEGNGKLLDYMAMGLPTVCFDTAVARETLGDSGIYVESGNDDDLARQLCWALDNPEAARGHGLRGRARVLASATWDRAALRITEIYQRVRRVDAEQGDVESTPLHDALV
jgi:glycosyltransferase involved in cell wall biosynthesis